MRRFTNSHDLTAATADRCREEEESILATVQRISEQNSDLELRHSQALRQNEALNALIQEQEAYLREVEAQIGRMEEHRRDWRQRYAELTGRAIEEPVGAHR